MFRKIAVVDDSEVLHHMYALVLMRYRAQGTQLVTARDGLQFLKLLSEHPDVELVLLDVNMPNMGGVETMMRLRASGRLPSLKVIVISTEGHEADVQKALALGARAYVTKPFKPSELHAHIENLSGQAACPAEMTP